MLSDVSYFMSYFRYKDNKFRESANFCNVCIEIDFGRVNNILYRHFFLLFVICFTYEDTKFCGNSTVCYMCIDLDFKKVNDIRYHCINIIYSWSKNILDGCTTSLKNYRSTHIMYYTDIIPWIVQTNSRTHGEMHNAMEQISFAVNIPALNMLR